MNQSRKGTAAVLYFLSLQNGPVPAGRISKATGVSSARTAVVLKKLEEKRLIIRTQDPADARKSLIQLSESGRKRTQENRDQMLDCMGRVIEEMGEDRFRQLVRLSCELRDAMLRNTPKCEEGLCCPDEEEPGE